MDLILGCVIKDGHSLKDLPWDSMIQSFSLQKQRELSFLKISHGCLCSNFPLTKLPHSLGIKGRNFLEIELKGELIQIRNDFFGMRSLFYCESQVAYYFCSEIEPLLVALMAEGHELSLHQGCVEHYLNYGVSSSGETFIQGVKLLRPGHLLSISSTHIKNEKQQKAKNLELASISQNEILEKVNQRLSDSIQDWIEKYQIKAANLSGGADTRLILAHLTQEQRESFQFITDKSPTLEEDNDKDVLIAKRLAEKFHLQHEIRSHEIKEIDQDAVFYRTEPVTIPKLSGNHGGEILGADVFGAMAFLKPQWKDSFNENYNFLVSQMFHPFFSDIYNGGVYNHWTMPFRFHARKCAPFWDQGILFLLSLLKEDQLSHYSFYAQVYRKYFSSFTKDSFFSPLAIHHSDFELMEKGENQKTSIPKKSPLDLLKDERELLKKNGLYQYEELLSLGKDHPRLMRCLKVNRFFDFFIKERKWS